MTRSANAPNHDEPGLPTPDSDRRQRLRPYALPPETASFSDEVMLAQIHETVRRVTAASLRGAAGDVLISPEDIAQDTLATLHAQRDRQPPENPLAWAIGVARLTLRAALRRSRTRGLPHALLPEEIGAAPGAGEPEQIVDLVQYVWLLDQLSTLDRMIVQGRQAGFSSREIAGELRHAGYPEMTANNVDQRFYRALKALRTRLLAVEPGAAPAQEQEQESPS
ncbi:MAG: sigma-70 family RNA polymerase sigma factor [Thermomicrobiales bacterium]